MKRAVNYQLSGFTIVELLVSMSILTLILLVTVSMVDQTQKVWLRTSAMISSFREARSAFETMTRRISQATLNTYLDYVDTLDRTRNEAEAISTEFEPYQFRRQSELHFVVGPAATLLASVPMDKASDFRPGQAIFFQAPLGFTDAPPTGNSQLSNLLNAVGYFILYSDDQAWMPSFLKTGGRIQPQRRFRLMQMVQGSEKLKIYSQAFTASSRYSWFQDSLASSPVLARPVANNIIAMAVWPRTAEEMVNDTQSTDIVSPLTLDYTYDSKAYLAGPGNTTSRNQLPPQIQITLVAIDERSAARLETIPAAEKSLLEPGALFNTSAPASRLKLDLEVLTDFLASKRLSYRVFSSTVTIRQAKFSKDP